MAYDAMGRAPQDELDIDKMAETELVRLQRQYRIMEGDRVVFGEETSGKLDKQRNMIRHLKMEREDLMTDLKVAQSRVNKQRDTTITAQLNDLLGQYDQYCDDIKTEKAHLEEIDEQIRKIERDVGDIKGKQITDAMCQQRLLTAKKSVGQLENRLEVATKQFNIILADNDKLRLEIDHLLKERAHFNRLWHRLISNLNRGKKFMLDLIEQATLAYDQREEWCNKLQVLKDRGKSDLIMHTQEMRELQRNLDHDGKLQDFLGIKGQRRLMTDLEAREAAQRKQVRDNMEWQLSQYREILQKIKEFSGEENVDRLAAQFVKQEEENFALFNYVNELNHELESLNDTVDELRRNIDEQRGLNSERVQQQEDTLAELQQQLDTQTIEANNAEASLKQSEARLDQLIQGVSRIFKLVKCDNAPVLKLLGDKVQVNPFNVHLYLGILEKRTNDLINAVYYKDKIATDAYEAAVEAELKEAKEAKEAPHKEPPHKEAPPKRTIREDFKQRLKVIPVKRTTPTHPCPLCVEQEEVRGIIDTIQEPLNRAEVEAKLAEKLALPDALEILHNVSACALPKSREVIQKRQSK